MTSHTVLENSTNLMLRFYLHWTLPFLELSFMISIIFSSSPFTIIVIIINAVKYLIITIRKDKKSLSKQGHSLHCHRGSVRAIYFCCWDYSDDGIIKDKSHENSAVQCTSDQHSLSRELTILWLPICFRVRNFSRSRFRLCYNKKKFL